MNQKLKVLAVDDDPTLLASLRRTLRDEAIVLFTLSNPYEVVDELNRRQVDLVLLDLRMPGRGGMDVLKDIKALWPELPVLMLTGTGGIQDAVGALKAGADDFLEKPCAPHLLQAKLAEYSPQQRAVEALSGAELFPDLIGESPAMLNLKHLIQKIAVSEASILVHGETGVGKELVARSIHGLSLRRGKPFVAVDCASFSEQIIESELFGHCRGAFTGAERNKQGLFQAADGGSLFLDEIGEFPMELQAKLLRALQERQVRPVGSNTTIPVDIRLIAATNRNLEEEAEQGRFRSDLYFRLAAIEIEVPLLRERAEDIPLIVAHFLARQGGGPGCDAEALELLQNYPWPGNIRELENVLTRAVALAGGAQLGVRDLPAKLVKTTFVTDKISLALSEKETLETALAAATGNRKEAARILGLSEATLYRKLKKAGLSKVRV